MTRRRLTITSLAVVFIASLFALQSRSLAKPLARVSHVFNVDEPWQVMAALPNTDSFLNELRKGDAMRAFFDSPLGLHFLRSVPLRGAAHLHKIISLAPNSWTWNLYTLITDGPVLYRSHASSFVLALHLNKKGRILSSLLPETAERQRDWLFLASDKKTLDDALRYAKSPRESDSPLDTLMQDTGTLSVVWRNSSNAKNSRSLVRALIKETLSLDTNAACQIQLRPSHNALALTGSCSPVTTGASTRSIAEDFSMPDFASYVYYKASPLRIARVLAFDGMTDDLGYLIPQIFYSGGLEDKASLEFLSEAFKTGKFSVQNDNGALLIRYAYPYTYGNRKFDLFAPHLATNANRFYWNSFIDDKVRRSILIPIKSDVKMSFSLKPYELVKNSEAAFNAMSPLYSPGHFSEFRDALKKTLPTLKGATVAFSAKEQNKSLQLGGILQFAKK